MTNSPIKIAVGCAGLGMGNASRISALIDSLNEKASVSIVVFCWGAGLDFLKERHRDEGLSLKVVALESYPRSSLSDLLKWPKVFLKNLNLIRKELIDFRPQAAVLDSDYHFFAYRKLGIPIYFIGQAIDVVSRARQSGYSPRSLKELVLFQFCERVDAWLQRIFAARIYVPCFRGPYTKSNQVVLVPLIVGRDFLEPRQTNHPSKALMAVLSGSQIGSKKLLSASTQNSFEARSPQQKNNSGLILRASELDCCEFVLTQGGLTSISEALARDKFVISIPIKDHPEQRLNAEELVTNNWGLHAQVEDLNQFDQLLDKARVLSRKKSTKPRVDGADVIAEDFFQALRQRDLNP